MRKKPSRCDRRKRSLGRGSPLWGFRVRGRVNYGKAPENAGDGRFGGVAPRIRAEPARTKRCGCTSNERSLLTSRVYLQIDSDPTNIYSALRIVQYFYYWTKSNA